MFTRSIVFSVLAVSATAFVPTPSSESRSSALNLAVGDTAPEFKLVDQNGKTVTRSAIKKPLVVYFYPGDSSKGCTIEANAFNENVGEIRKKYGAEVVGISGQDEDSKAKFSEELGGLDFSILADNGDEVRQAFGVPKALFGLFPGRVTYVLDKTGECVKVYDELGDAKSHVGAASDALDELKPVKSGGFEFKLPF
mmetsp:Transcript_24105/g.47878  ORF Transcript_24105/g.47878 Transcript_24105/m.47878 type:complete len:196 (-) Transcript_24105:31-618(-)